jgi:tight adherence protein B
VLFTTGFGFAVVVIAGAMMAGALWWLKLVADRAAPQSGDWSIEQDLFATAASGGMLPEPAMALVRSAMERSHLVGSAGSALADLVAMSRRAGVPVSALARAQAGLSRTLQRIEAESRVQRLGVHVVLPLGLLVLPAFVMIAIAPVLVGSYQSGFVEVSTTAHGADSFHQVLAPSNRG